LSVADQVSLLSADDLYLFNEGSHYRLYEKLGSHLMKVGNVELEHVRGFTDKVFGLGKEIVGTALNNGRLVKEGEAQQLKAILSIGPSPTSSPMAGMTGPRRSPFCVVASAGTSRIAAA